MPKGYPPTIFVSSTCYDLYQIRADLKSFLASFGAEPLLSESFAFPVSPHVKTVENCVNAVKERADIFILIVGTRYGSIDNVSGKSVTNLEYLAAKAKGIPIYVFLSKEMDFAFRAWKKTPENDYSKLVDTPELFKFVESLHEHWIFTFEEVKHIIEALRQQLAQLFMEGLVLLDKVRELKLPAILANLSGKSLRFVIERPIGWEFYLFASVLADEMEKDQELKWDLKHGLKIGRINQLEDLLSMYNWIQHKSQNARALAHSVEKLLTPVIKEAMGEQGVAGDPEKLVYVARRIAKSRRAFLEWSMEFNLAEIQPECERLFSLLSDSSKDVIEQLENFPAKVNLETDKAVEAQKHGKQYTINLKLTFTMINAPEVEAEFTRLGNLVGH